MTPGQGLNPNVASEAASQVRPLADEVWRTQVRIHPVSSAHIMAEMSLDKTSLIQVLSRNLYKYLSLAAQGC